MNVPQAIEILRCADINCDNTMKIGIHFVAAVKMQIQEALKLLDADEDA